MQTPQDVQLHIMIPNVSAEEIDVKWLEDKKLEIRFPTVQFHSDESGVLALNLFASVVPSKTKIECTPKKVTITLRKVKAAPWDKLEQSKKDAKRFAEGAEGLPAAIATDIAEMRAQDIDEIVSKIEGKTMVAGVLPPGKRGSTFNGKGTGSKGDSKRRSSAADPELTLVEEVEGTPVVTLPANWMQSSPVSNELDGTLPLSTEPANENEDGLVDAELAVGSLVPKPRAHLPAGLLNMGQTCYLNSILQAIVSIPAIGRYFSDDAYLKDINTENFLGHKGEVARAFATIVRQLLTPGAPSFKPKAFMDVLRRVWHILQDEYQQHDAQELMQFLLDAVHEDLNRVKDRKSVPPFEEKEGETDDAAAKRFWEHHNTLNDSEMVRLFQGLLKNKVECKSCGKVSFKFDPFMYFTVELPEERVQVEVRSTSVTGKRTVYPPQGMAKEARFEDVLKRLDLKDGIVCTLGEGGTMIKTVPKKNDRLSSMLTYAQSQGPVELASFDVERDCAYLALHHEAAMPGRVGARPAKFGYPLILSVPPGMYTRNELYRVVLDKLKACGVVSAAVDSSSDPPPFVVRPFDNKPRGPNSPVSPDESDDKKRAAEEAEQVGTVPPASEEPFASLQPTKFLRIALDWRPDAKDSVYLDKGFPDSDCDNEDGINGTLGAGSPAKAGSLLRTTSPTRFGPRSATNPPPITLEDCMHAFCAPEDLDNDWTCEKCKGKVGRKTLSLHSVPEIFIVALKRFRWLDNPGGYSYNKKIDVHVEFPLEMEMGGGQYKLFAVVNHYGSTFSGHCGLSDEWNVARKIH